jgi:LmbE family N-acetylglucosaminyl deacetylase
VRSYETSEHGYDITGAGVDIDAIPRRKLIGSVLAIPAAASITHGQPDTKHKLNIVVTGGHPGDPEYACGGTIARYTDLGHHVTLLYLNKGEGGCPHRSAAECSATRVAEAQKACEILKAQPAFAGQIDGHAAVDPETYERFRKLLDAEKPDVLFTHWPIDAHPDHRAISMLTYNAWLHMITKPALYFYEVSDGEDTQMFAPNDYVDISGMEARKREACYAHASQAPDHFYPLQRQVTTFRGIQSGYAQAEAYIRYVKSPGGLLP